MTLGPAVQKLLALALLAGLGFALWVGVLVPIKDGFDRNRASAAQSAALIQRFRQVLAGMPALESEVERLRAHPILKKGVFVAPSAEIGAAALQGTVKAAAAAADAKLISIQVLPAKDEKAFTRIGVRARLSGTVAALRGVLYELQAAWPALVVDAVNVRARTRRQRPEGGAPATLLAMPELAIRFDVYGFMAHDEREAGPNGGGGRK
ncbi:MAG: type II secretion system protein GspM [Alphaproteobacteria bacterium]|nr:type II secretion system protein GspM [Alphaproteobacteria bacterium]